MDGVFIMLGFTAIISCSMFLYLQSKIKRRNFRTR